jgi:hypothetical protein
VAVRRGGGHGASVTVGRRDVAGSGTVMGGGFEFKKRNQIQINSNGFKLLQTLTTTKMPFPSSKILNKNMGLKLSKRLTTF